MDGGSNILRTNFAGGMYELAGQLISERHRRLNAIAGRRNATHLAKSQDGGDSHFSPLLLDVVKITDASDTCANSENFGETIDAPCSNSNLYQTKHRYYDSIDKQWKEYDEVLPLDAGAYYTSDPNDAVNSPVTDHANRQVPDTVAGDMCPALWDELRNMRVPIMDAYQDVVQAEFWTNAQPVFQSPAWQQQERHEFADVYLEIRRPTDVDWRQMSSLNWLTPHCEATRDWRDSRANFALFQAPYGTLVRLRAVSSSTNTIGVERAQLRLWGAGRSASGTFFSPYETQAYAGGVPISGWQLRADTAGRFKESPLFTHVGGGVFQITYADPLDAWMIGCDFYANLTNLDFSYRGSLALEVVISITCDQEITQQETAGETPAAQSQGITEYCTKTLTIPPEIANCLIVGDEVCISCTPESTTSTLSTLSTATSSTQSLQSLSTPSTISSSTQSQVESTSSTISSSTLSTSSTLSSSTLSTSSTVSSSTLSTSSTLSGSSLSTSSTLSSSTLSTSSTLSSSTLSSSTLSTSSTVSSSTLSTSSTVSSSTLSTSSTLSVSTLSTSSTVSSSTLSSSTSSTRTECCSGGECSWVWNDTTEMWELTDTCTGLDCDPDTCICTNDPTRDGLFNGEIWLGYCVPQ